MIKKKKADDVSESARRYSEQRLWRQGRYNTRSPCPINHFFCQFLVTQSCFCLWFMIYISWFSTVFPDILNHCWTPVLTQTNIEWKEENPINANKAHWIVSDLSLCCVGRVQSTCIIHVYTSFLHVHRRIVQKVVFSCRTHSTLNREQCFNKERQMLMLPYVLLFRKTHYIRILWGWGWVSVYRDFTRCRLNTWKW